MYIPAIVILVILFVIAFYIEKLKNDKQHAVEEKEKEIKEDQRQKLIEEAESKRESELSCITDSLNLSKNEAETFLSFLDRKDKKNVFIYTDDDCRRSELYKQFLNEQNEIVVFKKRLAPIIESEHLTQINIDNLFYYYKEDIETVRNDIPLKEKLKQFNNEKCYNTLYLAELLHDTFQELELGQYVTVSKSNSKSNGFNRYELLQDDIYKIIDIFNNVFELNIKNTKYICFENYEYFDYCLEYDELLKNLFVICLFESDIISKKIRNKHISDSSYQYAYKSFICDLFFYRPYYNLLDYKKVISTNIDEFKKEQKYWLR